MPLFWFGVLMWSPDYVILISVWTASATSGKGNRMMMLRWGPRSPTCTIRLPYQINFTLCAIITHPSVDCSSRHRNPSDQAVHGRRSELGRITEAISIEMHSHQQSCTVSRIIHVRSNLNQFILLSAMRTFVFLKHFENGIMEVSDESLLAVRTC